jgi:hypothetical protein
VARKASRLKAGKCARYARALWLCGATSGSSLVAWNVEAPWIPLLVLRTLELISSRVGNYVYSIWVAGALLDQLWVR